jgi:hypothetical protein
MEFMADVLGCVAVLAACISCMIAIDAAFGE